MKIPDSYPKKVILCLHHFLPEFVAGTEIYTYNLARCLNATGIETIILIPNFGFDKTEEYLYEGIRVIKYAENSIEDRKLIKGLRKPDGLAEFENILTREAPEIVHFHELAPGRGISIFHVERAHALNFRIITSLHLSAYTCLRGSLMYMGVEKCDGLIDIAKCTRCLYDAKNMSGIGGRTISNFAKLLYKLNLNTYKLNTRFGTALGFPFMVEKQKSELLRLCRYSEKIIVLADWYKKVLLTNDVPEEKITYIMQGLAHTLNVLRDTNKVNKLPLKIVFIGRITKIKGVDLLIEAVSTIQKDKLALYIYGPETDPGFSKMLKEKTKNSSNIFWNGVIPASEILECIARHDILCLPSTSSEMSPMVIQEAFAAGVPVLASDMNGNAEQIKHSVNGWLFSNNDGAKLSELLARLIEFPELIGRARKNIPKQRSFEEVAEEHVNVYINAVDVVKNSRESRI